MIWVEVTTLLRLQDPCGQGDRNKPVVESRV